MCVCVCARDLDLSHGDELDGVACEDALPLATQQQLVCRTRRGVTASLRVGIFSSKIKELKLGVRSGGVVAACDRA